MLIKLLSQPYPTDESTRRQFTKATVIGGFIGLFLLIFQPFGLDDWQTPDKTAKILGFGLVTFGVTLADSLLLPLLFPRYFSDRHWTVGREIVRTTLLIFVIAVGNRLYLDQISGYSSTLPGWVRMIGMTFVIGIFPTVGAVFVIYLIQLRKFSRGAARFPDFFASSAVKGAYLRERVSVVRTVNTSGLTLILVADNEKDVLSLRPDALLFIESSDNYCTVVYLKSNPTSTDRTAKLLLRSSLSRLEAQVTGSPSSDATARHPHIVRCHRSYIVNLDRVERVTGNAQGYKLHLLGGQFQVPVARRFNDSLVRRLTSLM